MLARIVLEFALMLGLWWLPPMQAAKVAQLLYPDLPAHFLERTAWHESRGRYKGIHAADRKHAARNWIVARKKPRSRRALQPETCAHHRDHHGAGTRGAFGLVAVYHLRYIRELGCTGYAVFDVPMISALASARKAQRFCAKRPRQCTANRLRILWAGSQVPREDVLRRWAESAELFE